MAVNLSDTNVAGIGGEEDQRIRQEAARTETAWEGAGTETGILIWRVENFSLVSWPVEKYGSFHRGDSYVVLHTFKTGGAEKLFHEAHFWLGSQTSVDEQGTAAYKTVELDDFLGGGAVQTRNVEGHESSSFLKLFGGEVAYLEGGAASGFKAVESGAQVVRLFRVWKGKGRGGVRVIEVPCKIESLNEGDCFLLDCGDEIYVWEGTEASPFEKSKAGMSASNRARRRHGGCKVVFEIGSRFWSLLGAGTEENPRDSVTPADSAEAPSEPDEEEEGTPVLYRVSDSEGTLKCTETARGELALSMLDSSDVFLVDAGKEVFVWLGVGASEGEKKGALATASLYLKTLERPLWTPVHVVREGQEVKHANWEKTFNLQ